MAFAWSNRGYPSTRASIAELAPVTLLPAMARCGSERVHFVTHSMGGILLRYWLARHRPRTAGPRGDAGAPPTRDPRSWMFWGPLEPFEWINGPAGMQLGTGETDLPNRLPPVDFDLGVIAGNQTLNPFYSALIPGEDDGKGRRRQHAGGGDGRSHRLAGDPYPFMMNNPLVIGQTIAFLRYGAFDHEMGFIEAIEDLVE